MSISQAAGLWKPAPPEQAFIAEDAETLEGNTVNISLSAVSFCDLAIFYQWQGWWRWILLWRFWWLCYHTRRFYSRNLA